MPTKQLLEKLAESERQKSYILSNSPTFIFYLDRDYRYILANNKYSSLTGVSLEGIEGKKCYQYYQHRDNPCPDCPITRVLETGREVETEICRDGRTYLQKSVPISEDGIKGVLSSGFDITERKRAEEKNQHLMQVLRAIRNVNQLITKEKDQRKLLKGACKSLTESRGYYSAWIALLDESGKLTAHAESGLGKDFQPMVERLNQGKIPACGQTALKRSEVVVTEDPALICTDCPISHKCAGRGGMSVRLEHGGKVYGLLAVSVPLEQANDAEELGLLHEVAGDIAFALQDIEVEEQRRRLEHDAAERVKELDCLYGIAGIAEIPGLTVAEIYQKVVEILPASWQYPEIACARITAGDGEFKTANYRETDWRQSSAIRVKGDTAGYVEVGYLEKKPALYEGPFLKEERLLIDAIAERLGKITDRKKAEESVIASEAKYRFLTENMTDVIFTMDLDMNMTYVSPSVERMLGFTSEERMKQHPKEQLTPESYKLALETLQSALEKEISTGIQDNQLFDLELEYYHKDGTTRILEVICKPIRDERGNLTGVYGLCHDITDRKKAEDALREEHNLFVGGPTVVFKWAAAEGWPIEYVSPNVYRMLGYTDKELMESKHLYSEIIHPNDLPRVTEEFNRCIDGEYRPFVSEYRVLHKKGSVLWLHEHAIPIRDEKGEVIRNHGYVNDISDRKKAEQEKRDLERKAQVTDRLASVGEMASGVAHEINNPLTGVVGFSELLMQKELPEDIKDEVRIIHDGAQRVSGIVKRLLSFARHHKPVRSRANINEIVENTLSLRTYSMKTGNIEVITSLDPELPWTVADIGQLQQVFMNIIVNAETEMKRAHDGGKLTVRTEQAGEMIRISFKDDGPGIARENLAKVFDPFFTTREVGEGTGLGLSLSYGIIKEHKGNLYAESRKGKGATFFVEVPLIAEAEQLEMDELEETSGNKTSGGRILAIDDEPNILSLLEKVLTGEGYNVETAGSGKEALEMIRNKSYSAVLCDIKLPWMSGKEIYEKIGKIAPSLKKRVIFITGDTIGSGTAAFLEKTKTPYLNKPVDTKLLRREVNRVVITPTE
ncbi:MAG: PAS domain S-box protein [Dehalococcoidales bacterium]|nr:PAS domain S-box protein [Dehalococcoidales bacterium]